MKHYRIFLFLFFVLDPAKVCAIESISDREAVVAPRTKKFYKAERARQYVSLGGIYSSDYNSKSYQLNSRYLYQSRNYIHEINFKHETDYANSGSGKNKKYNVKTSELYDLSLASKARILETQNYGVLFNRNIYDKFSKEYYNNRIAAGLGRMFFRERLELDASMGYHETKLYGHEVDFIISWRANFKLSDNLTFIQRAFWFFDHESLDNDIKTSIVYRLGDRMSFEVRHNFERRRYEENDQYAVTNLISRSITVGLIFDLN